MSDLDELKQWWGVVCSDPRAGEVAGRVYSSFLKFGNLTDDELLSTSVTRLATLRGMEQYHDALLAFADSPDFDFAKPVPETYDDPVDEANSPKVEEPKPVSKPKPTIPFSSQKPRKRKPKK